MIIVAIFLCILIIAAFILMLLNVDSNPSDYDSEYPHYKVDDYDD